MRINEFITQKIKIIICKYLSTPPTVDKLHWRAPSSFNIYQYMNIIYRCTNVESIVSRCEYLSSISCWLLQRRIKLFHMLFPKLMDAFNFSTLPIVRMRNAYFGKWCNKNMLHFIPVNFVRAFLQYRCRRNRFINDKIYHKFILWCIFHQ